LPRPSPALVIACASLFISLGGVSYGLATGSIGSKEIRNGSIRARDIHRRAITRSRIRSRAVGTAQLANGAATAPKLGRITRRLGSLIAVPPGQGRHSVASCHEGETPISGGGIWYGVVYPHGGEDLRMRSSYAGVQGTSEYDWVASGFNGETGKSYGFRAQVLCLAGEQP
jgi:hypothetical protein